MEFQERFVWQFWFVFEDVAKATEVLVVHATFIGREGVFAPDLPEERCELVLQTVFLHVPQHFNFAWVVLEVRPNIVVEWHHDITIQ